MHGVDSERNGTARRLDLNALFVQKDFASVGLDRTRQDFDEGRLAGAVFSAQGQYFAARGRK
jgi:hypothetical protein